MVRWNWHNNHLYDFCSFHNRRFCIIIQKTMQKYTKTIFKRNFFEYFLNKNKKASHFVLACFQILFQCNYFTRSTYEPSAVFILTFSPSLINKGTRIVAPVSTVAGFVALVAVSPFNPGSV